MGTIDLRPLRQGVSGDAFLLFGVARVGDPVEHLRSIAWEQANDEGPDEPRTYRDGRVFRTGPDGREEEIPLVTRVERVLRSGRGVLAAGGVSVRIEGGRIARAFVRGAALEALGVDRIERISAVFGAPEGVSRRFGRVTHHYPSRALAVEWDARASFIEHVALGPDPWREPSLGARELLVQLLEAAEDLEHGRWREPSPEHRGGWIRWHRIDALCRALGVGGVAALVAGSFLERADRTRFTALLDEIAARSAGGLGSRYAPVDLLYNHLLTYRLDAQRVIRATEGWLECSEAVLLGMIATQNEIARRLASDLADIDRWLAILIDPDERTFREHELIERFGYPDVDLDLIDDREL